MARKLSPTVKCEICYTRFKALAGHLKKHKLTIKEYKVQYPHALAVSALTRRRMQLSRLRYILRKKAEQPEKYQSEKAIKLALANRGRRHTPEAIEKIRQARLGSKLSEDHKLAISAGLLGHKVSVETRHKLSSVVITEERRRKISESQSAEKGNAWKGGISRHLYFGKNKHRLKKIFGNPLKCFFPGCDRIEGTNIKSVDCHHLDGNHEHNPLDGSNWLPLCRKHHMLVDGRLGGSTEEEVTQARGLAQKAHAKHLKSNYVGEIKTYHG